MSSTRTSATAARRSSRASGSANKLFNAARCSSATTAGGPGARRGPSAVEDRWILSRLARASRERWPSGSRRYDFAHAALALYEFVYGELCDWYLELVKGRRGRRAELAGDAAASCCAHARLAHPVMPFVTEEM